MLLKGCRLRVGPNKGKDIVGMSHSQHHVGHDAEMVPGTKESWCLGLLWMLWVSIRLY